MGGAPLYQHGRRPGAGIFRRRHGRGDHHCALAHPLALRDRAQFEFHLQGPIHRCEAGRCGSIAELRSVILKARLAHDDAERERAAAAVKTWLLAQIDKNRTAPATDIEEPALDKPFTPDRLAA